MKPRTNGVPRAQNSRNFQGEGPNWVLLAGGALLSTLSIRLGFKLKQALDTKPQENARSVKPADKNKSGACRLHSNTYSFTREDGSCFNCVSGSEGTMDINHHQPNGQILRESDVALPLVMVPAPEYTKENGGAWASSPERLELPPKPFHHSNCSDSPCVSESGSDIFSKREVIQKLRQQLKKRDDMILEMQDQIMELQNSLNSQLSHSAHLQAQIDAANRDLFDSEREIQRLRKAIADHCVGQLSLNENTSPAMNCLSEPRNGYANGYLNGDTNLDSPEKGRGDSERIEMLKREVRELREVMEGKEYLLQSYKEQKVELSMKIKELQQRLDFQLPNIL